MYINIYIYVYIFIKRLLVYIYTYTYIDTPECEWLVYFWLRLSSGDSWAYLPTTNYPKQTECLRVFLFGRETPK